MTVAHIENRECSDEIAFADDSMIGAGPFAQVDTAQLRDYFAWRQSQPAEGAGVHISSFAAIWSQFESVVLHIDCLQYLRRLAGFLPP